MLYSRLYTFDISDINNPTEIEHNLFDELRGSAIEVVGNYAYLARGGDEAELIVVDISDFDNFEVISRTEGPFGSMRYMTVSGDYAVMGSARYVFCFEVSDPENPVYIGAHVTEEPINDIALSDQYLYLAVGEDGIQMLDISNPDNIVEAGFYNTVGKAWDIELGHNMIIVADDTNVGIYENTLLSAPEYPPFRESPDEFDLYPAFPNPFNSSARVDFTMPVDGSVSLSLYNLNG